MLIAQIVDSLHAVMYGCIKENMGIFPFVFLNKAWLQRVFTTQSMCWYLWLGSLYIAHVGIFYCLLTTANLSWFHLTHIFQCSLSCPAREGGGSMQCSSLVILAAWKAPGHSVPPLRLPAPLLPSQSGRLQPLYSPAKVLWVGTASTASSSVRCFS